MSRILQIVVTVITSLLCVVATSGRARAGAVRIAQRPQLAPFGSIQQAIDVAIDGETLIVGTGTYPAFSIDNRKLAVLAAPGATVTIQGTVRVSNLGGLRWVVLGGLSIAGPIAPANYASTGSLPALVLESNNGHVWLFDCTLTGGAGQVPQPSNYYYGNGGHGAVMIDSRRVAMTRCTITAGNGGSDNNIYAYETYGGAGGTAIDASGSALALYQCTLTGGNAGNGGTSGGVGGHGIRIIDYGVYLGRCVVKGGNGGKTWDYLVYENYADGGHGVYVDASAQAQVLDSTSTGGAPGVCFFCGTPANPGLPFGGTGIITQHSGTGRTFNAARIAADGSQWQVTATGVPGDVVLVVESDVPAYSVPQPALGVWLVPPPPSLRRLVIGQVPPSGTLIAQIALPALAPGENARSRFLQGLAVDASHTLWPSTPFFRATLDDGALPDCNGNARNDLLDVLLFGATDADRDLVPDTCDHDCNSNTVIDGLDIGAGTSQDRDHDWIPDECESTRTWYVDASAPQGGDGGFTSAFRGLRPALSASLAGDTVIAFDGTYRGSENREVDFAGKNVTVRSANGPLACVIDLQDQGRAFRLRGNETSAAQIRGFTFRDGATVTTSYAYPALIGYGGAILADAASPTIVDCAFESCSAQAAGGALYLNGGRIDDCAFVANSATTSNGSGGAVFTGGDTLINGCSFENNSGREGGALAAAYSQGIDVSIFASVFVGNSATAWGGALFYRSGFGTPRMLIAESLIAGNSCANDGGGVYGCSWYGGEVTRIELRGATLVGNSANHFGSGLYLGCSCECQAFDSIVWDNPSTSGRQAYVGSLFSPASLEVGWSDWQAGVSGVTVAGGASLTWGSGNIDADPLFTSPSSDNYRLSAGSPCIDAGDNTLIATDLADRDLDLNTTELDPLDLDGNSRFVDDPLTPDTGPTSPAVDLGAYERP